MVMQNHCRTGCKLLAFRSTAYCALMLAAVSFSSSITSGGGLLNVSGMKYVRIAITTQLNRKHEIAEMLKALSRSLETTGIIETAMYPLAETTWTAIPLTWVGKSSN